jgi:hypothetical protein
MLKRDITYEDFNGDTVTETFYFNISKPELIELDVEYEGGMSGFLQKIIDSKNGKELVSQFKRIVLLAYGQKSEDGKRFIKNDQLREEFSQTAAYQSLFMELAQDDNAAVVFLKGVLPKDLVVDQDKPQAPPAAVPPTAS